MLLSRAISVTHHTAQGGSRLMLKENVQDTVNSVRSRFALDIVEGKHEIGTSQLTGSTFDYLPGAKQIGQGQSGVVVRERSAKERCTTWSGGYSRNNLHLKNIILGHELKRKRSHPIDTDIPA